MARKATTRAKATTPGSATSAPAQLADRVRAALAPLPVTETRMFGGIAFMLDGKMVASASKRRLLLRVGKDGQAEALRNPSAKVAEMGARRMSGYVRIVATVTDGEHTGRGEGRPGPERWMYQYFGSLGSAIAGGSSNIQRNIIAQRGFGLPRDQRRAED